MTLPLNGMPFLPAPMNSEMNHMSLYLNGDIGVIAASASGQKLPARDVEAIYVSRKKRPSIETEILAGPEYFNEKLLINCRLLCQVVSMIDSHEDEYEYAHENDPARVRFVVIGNDTVHFSPLSFWPKAALNKSVGEPFQNFSCTIDFTIFFCVSQPLFNYNPKASHREFLIMKISTIPAPTDAKNCSKRIGGLRFFLLLAIMDAMLIGTTTLAECANHAARLYF
jgi:hypothetical protein